MKRSKVVIEPSEIAFIKTDKSRILEVRELDGKFDVVGVYTRINISNVDVSRHHPRPMSGVASTYKKTKVLEDVDDVDDDASKVGGGEERTSKDPLYSRFPAVPAEKVNRAIELLNMRTSSAREICVETGMQMRTLMKIILTLKELGRLDEKYSLTGATE